MARVVCVCREGMDYSRSTFDFLEDFYRKTGKQIEVLDPDREDGFCRAYDVVEYPTILALDNNGKVLASWRGKEMPLIDEVNYYLI